MSFFNECYQLSLYSWTRLENRYQRLEMDFVIFIIRTVDCMFQLCRCNMSSYLQYIHNGQMQSFDKGHLQNLPYISTVIKVCIIPNVHIPFILPVNVIV